MCVRTGMLVRCKWDIFEHLYECVLPTEVLQCVRQVIPCSLGLWNLVGSWSMEVSSVWIGENFCIVLWRKILSETSLGKISLREWLKKISQRLDLKIFFQKLKKFFSKEKFSLSLGLKKFSHRFGLKNSLRELTWKRTVRKLVRKKYSKKVN